MREFEGLRVVVLGCFVRAPLAGMAWSTSHYALGLRALGCDVLYVEDGGDHVECYDPRSGETGMDPSYGLAFAEEVLSGLGLGGHWAYWDGRYRAWAGPAATAASNGFEADIVLNLAAVNVLRGALQDVPVRALVDEDPAFTQLRHLRDPSLCANAARHTHFLTFGENYGRPGCSIPDDGFPWRRTRQPVVLGAVPMAPPRPEGRFTTVMQWHSYPAVEHEGRRFGLKADAFTPFLDLPRRTGDVFDLGVASRRGRQALELHGWTTQDPAPLTRAPASYLAFIGASKGEFAVAKEGYVTTASGWFSERSVAYLATGRPVIAQDTGFGVPTGDGLLRFSTIEEAESAIEDCGARYGAHHRDARELAREHFAHDKVLPDLLRGCLERSVVNSEWRPHPVPCVEHS